MDTALGTTPTPTDVAKAPVDGFGSLRVALGAISAVYTNYKVRLRPLLIPLL